MTILSGRDPGLHPDTAGPSALEFAADQPPAEPADVPYVSIVLPCHNEEGHVVKEVARICAAMDASGYAYELIAYDDASTDSTLACRA